jgi:hypothetical protein
MRGPGDDDEMSDTERELAEAYADAGLTSDDVDMLDDEDDWDLSRLDCDDDDDDDDDDED